MMVASVSADSSKSKFGTLIVLAARPFSLRGGLTGLSFLSWKKLASFECSCMFVLLLPWRIYASDSLRTLGSGDSSGSSSAMICSCRSFCLSSRVSAVSCPSMRRASWVMSLRSSFPIFLRMYSAGSVLTCGARGERRFRL